MVQEHLAANGDLGRPFDHHPMLRPVVVLLERKLAARLDDDALHLETLAPRQRFVTPPRAVDQRVVFRLAAPLRFQGLHNFLHVLRAGAIRHQHAVRRLHDHQIRYAERGDHPLGGVQIAVFRALGVHIPHEHVAVPVMRGGFIERLP